MEPQVIRVQAPAVLAPHIGPVGSITTTLPGTSLVPSVHGLPPNARVPDPLAPKLLLDPMNQSLLRNDHAPTALNELFDPSNDEQLPLTEEEFFRMQNLYRYRITFRLFCLLIRTAYSILKSFDKWNMKYMIKLSYNDHYDNYKFRIKYCSFKYWRSRIDRVVSLKTYVKCKMFNVSIKMTVTCCNDVLKLAFSTGLVMNSTENREGILPRQSPGRKPLQYLLSVIPKLLQHKILFLPGMVNKSFKFRKIGKLCYIHKFHLATANNTLVLKLKSTWLSINLQTRLIQSGHLAGLNQCCLLFSSILLHLANVILAFRCFCDTLRIECQIS